MFQEVHNQSFSHVINTKWSTKVGFDGESNVMIDKRLKRKKKIKLNLLNKSGAKK